MLVTPQSSGKDQKNVPKKSVPKKKRGKEVVASADSEMLSPTTQRARGRKILAKSTEGRLEVEHESLLKRKRDASSSNSTDADAVSVTKKVKMSEAVMETSSSPKVSVGSSAKNTSKKGVDRSVEKPAMTRRKAVKTSDSSTAKKSGRKATVIAAGLSSGQASESTTSVEAEQELAAGNNSANIYSRQKPVRRIVADGSMNATKQVGKKSQAARKPTVVVGDDESLESSNAAMAGRSKGSRSVKKMAAPVHSEKMSQTVVEMAKAKVLVIDLSASKPTVGRKGKPTANEQLIPSSNISAKSPISTRTGRRQVAVAVESVNVQKRGQESSAVTAVAVRRRGKHQFVDEELKLAEESNTIRTPARGHKRPQTAKAKELRVDLTANKPVTDQRGKPAKSKQLESSTDVNVSAKSPISTRSGKRRVVVSADSINVQKKGQKSPAVVAVAVGRRGKRQLVDEELKLEAETSNLKTPRSRKRTLTADGKESSVDSTEDRPVVGRRGKPAKCEKFESTTGSISAKSPVSTRRGKQQVTLDAAKDDITQQKGPENVKVAGRKRKHDGQQQLLETSQRKPSSRQQKRSQTSDKRDDIPVAKKQRQQAEEMTEKTKKPRGKSSTSSGQEDHITLPDKSQKKNGTKQSAGKKADSVAVLNDHSNSKKSGSKKEKKAVVTKKMAMASPAITRSKRTKR